MQAYKATMTDITEYLANLQQAKNSFTPTMHNWEMNMTRQQGQNKNHDPSPIQQVYVPQQPMYQPIFMTNFNSASISGFGSGHGTGDTFGYHVGHSGHGSCRGQCGGISYNNYQPSQFGVN